MFLQTIGACVLHVQAGEKNQNKRRAEGG